VRQLGVDPHFIDRDRQPGLDLLRALAIVVVVIYHAGIMGFPLSGDVHRFGWIGVDLFFVLSGYLIGGQLLAPLARGQRMNLGTFFARRAFRIMPAYFVMLGIYFFVAIMARISPDVAAALEISVVGAKHRTSWRRSIFTRVVARR
jgi:peptidoglycan/LPS O-acetylase OafA/YrhL